MYSVMLTITTRCPPSRFHTTVASGMSDTRFSFIERVKIVSSLLKKIRHTLHIIPDVVEESIHEGEVLSCHCRPIYVDYLSECLSESFVLHDFSGHDPEKRNEERNGELPLRFQVLFVSPC